MSCGGSDDMRIPIRSSGCGPTEYLYISRRGGGCSPSRTTFSVDSGGCGGKVPASDNDIRRAFDNLRRYRHKHDQ